MRKNRKLRVELGAAEQRQLERLLGRGMQSVRVIKRTQALRLLARGQSSPEVGRNVGLSAQTVRAVGWRYQQGGLARSLYDMPRPGAKRHLKVAEEQRILAMACGPPPAGRPRWTIRLIAEEAVKRKLGPGVGRETIRVLLQCHELKPWQEQNVVGGRGR